MGCGEAIRMSGMPLKARGADESKVPVARWRVQAGSDDVELIRPVEPSGRIVAGRPRLLHFDFHVVVGVPFWRGVLALNADYCAVAQSDLEVGLGVLVKPINVCERWIGS
jgi:hypothetical protein